MLLVLITSALLAAGPKAAPAKVPPKTPAAKSAPAKADAPASAPAPAPEPAPAPAPAATPAPAPAAAIAKPAGPTATGKPPLKLAAPGLQQVGLTKELAGFYSDHFAQQLALAGVLVTTPSEIQAVLGIERQRQLLGCSDEAACVTDIASALGVDGVLTGAVAKVGSAYQLNVKVIDSKNGAGLSVASVSAANDTELLDEMGRAARAMAKELFGKLDREPVGGTAQKDASAGWVRRRAWIPAVAGVVLAGGGAVLMVSGNQDFYALRDSLKPADLGAKTPEAFAATGQLKQVAGLSMAVVGGAALVSAGAMFLFGGEKDSAVALVAPLPTGGAVFTVSGALP